MNFYVNMPVETPRNLVRETAQELPIILSAQVGKWQPMSHTANRMQRVGFELNLGLHGKSVWYRAEFKPHFGELGY